MPHSRSVRLKLMRLALPAAVFLILSSPCSARAQTIRVDITASRAISFDPDKALGTSVDILPANQIDRVYSPEILKESLSAGWGPITYRQNTELTIAAWHWNPNGVWSDAAHQSGYFTGSAEPKEFIRQSFGYSLPHRGMTRTDASQDKYSRLTDGDATSYWKSNPYLSQKFTGEDDALHPQWMIIDFDTPQEISAIRISWAAPYARRYVVQYWTGDEALSKPTAGVWTAFPGGEVADGKGGSVFLKLANEPIRTRYLRVLMTESSNTCDTHGSGDPRNCVGYAVNEVYAGNFTGSGEFIDLISHARGQNQTATYVSSTDPWHTVEDIEPSRVQTGFDLFFTSGITNKLPAMIPIAMIYSTPEDAAAELAYIEKRGYAVSYVEMGEEPDGKNFSPEDYGALYLQFADALHRVDPKLRLGGPIFEGMNEDLKVWPDALGRTSWLGRFIDYLKAHHRLGDLTFVSFEHYPFPPCEVTWPDLYREPAIQKHVVEMWREDGVPAEVPLMNTESNVSWALTEPMADTFAALWLADSVGAFLANGGAAYYHSPIQPEPLRPGCHGYSTYGNFVANEKLEVQQYTSQYFASRLINLEWVRHGAGVHQLFPGAADVRDDAGHELITAYPVKLPSGEWSLLLINKDPSNAHTVKIEFASEDAKLPRHFAGALTMVTFGAEQYVWHPAGRASHAEPDGPPATSHPSSGDGVVLPRASVTVLRGSLQ
ncbi:MAG TPA: discoidin domain-containing protein [Candidatus Acidoferrales bacterium]|nr:discoidin domain-containing protein [Candidatus Acidoferrales bacterium]